MVQTKRYQLPPTQLIPNSPWALIHYRGAIGDASNLKPEDVHNLFHKNGWQTQWIFRYGPTQRSHYHSTSHECMAVLTGTATIRFGVADTSTDMEENTYGSARELGGIEIEVQAGDVLVIPAGVAHKTHNTSPTAEFQLLSPNNDHHDITASDLSRIDLSGFTMIGAYPANSNWDFSHGGEHTGNFQQIWAIPKPLKDPVLGESSEGLCGQWV